MERLSELYGRLLAALALAACALLFLMMLMICADVLLRNVLLIPSMRGLAWSNEVSESMLYLITMLTAPCEWVADALALACSVVMMSYGWSATAASYGAGSMAIKTLITPEWWTLAPLPVAFGLLAIEVLFRMQRLYAGERGPRADAVSAG